VYSLEKKDGKPNWQDGMQEEMNSKRIGKYKTATWL
jgi:hypothetical protein